MDKNSNENIIEMREVTLTKEELTRDYVDIKQASQILNNVSTKTAYRYMDKVSKSHSLNIRNVEVVSNGGLKKLYLKEDILKLARILNKDKTVLVHAPANVLDKDVLDNEGLDSVSVSSPSNVEEMSNSVREMSTGDKELSISNHHQKLSLLEGLRSIGDLKEDIRALNGNVRDVSLMMQNTVSKIVEQGIDLKERYLEDRIKRTDIERAQAEAMAKQNETMLKTSEALAALAQKKSGTGIIILVTILSSLAVAGLAFGFYIFNKNVNEKLEQDRKINLEQNTKLINSLNQLQSEIKKQKEAQIIHEKILPANNATEEKTQ